MNFVLIIICFAWIAFLISRLFQLFNIMRSRRLFTVGISPANLFPRHEPLVEIFIPACNEEANIERCLSLALDQDYSNYRVVLINDRSQDNTGNIAREIAKRDSRLRVLDIDELPDGWTGKSHALWHAASKSDADWFLFLDADLYLHRSALRAGLLECERRELNLFTLFPSVLEERFLIPAVMPLCGAIIGLWFQPSRVNDPEKPKDGFANGQFLLVDRQTYHKVDGHRSVRKDLNEDVAFGQLAKISGAKVFEGIAPALATVRMYEDGAAMIRGFTRSFAGALKSKLKILFSLAIVLLGFIPYVALIVVLVRARADAVTIALGSLAVIHLFISTIVSWQMWDIARCSKTWILLYPFALLVTSLILVRAWILLWTRRLEWRGTYYEISVDAKIISNQDRK